METRKEDYLLSVYLSRMIAVVWKALKIRSDGRVKSQRMEKMLTLLSFFFFSFFLTAHTLLHPGWFTPPIAIPWIEQALFEITTDLMYHNNSLITLQKIKHQSCEGLCFQSRGLRKRFTDAGLQNRDSAKQTYNEERWRLLSLSYE